MSEIHPEKARPFQQGHGTINPTLLSVCVHDPFVEDPVCPHSVSGDGGDGSTRIPAVEAISRPASHYKATATVSPAKNKPVITI